MLKAVVFKAHASEFASNTGTNTTLVPIWSRLNRTVGILFVLWVFEVVSVMKVSGICVSKWN